MSLMLELLKPCLVDSVALIQSQAIKLPPDGVKFMLDMDRSLNVLVVSDKSAFSRRLYAIDQRLAQELGDVVKLYAFGAVGMMQVNLQSKDGYSTAKRQILEAATSTYSVTRLADSYAFSESEDNLGIAPIADREYNSILELIFSQSIIDCREHPIFRKLATPALPNHDENEENEDKSKKGSNTVSLPPVSDVLSIDIDFENVNDLL
ncbi:hypothetical protein [Aeromonas salmonicida]|uniref:hypothetical protein n=1 Tax=Aeromonas salmonicida TaxID=645 RepID=UPI00224079B5|nr:hypothetical protein [Aeromonas salmonicida]